MSEQPPERVRVTSPRTGDRARRRTPLSAATEIDAQTEVGLLFLGSLLRTQLRLALGVLLLLVLTVGSLPVLFGVFPDVAAVRVLGMPLAWVVLAFGVYPLLLLLGVLFVRRAERNEDAFADVIEGP
ncbi:hypothetical protein K8W59_17225 [Nocardioides rotundus]|uniref:hypothetical protein n=1 Tax=Nocardioides rotundus TaxID=1774216 RepID=UPI001CBACB95|nr:hypothetical protein [Nocardioides rotundus]UAL29475.1 hypothetical protein K8W59_17225 [Nocardioides rotundus]